MVVKGMLKVKGRWKWKGGERDGGERDAESERALKVKGRWKGRRWKGCWKWKGCESERTVKGTAVKGTRPVGGHVTVPIFGPRRAHATHAKSHHFHTSPVQVTWRIPSSGGQSLKIILLINSTNYSNWNHQICPVAGQTPGWPPAGRIIMTP
jgi:hypothetical protein